MGNLIKFRNPISVISSACVAGKKESEGALGGYFDLSDATDKFGKDTFEKAESEMQRLALNIALKKARIREAGLSAIFAGDLMNQCVGSSYGMASFGSSFFGLYGACSTAAEGLILGALSLESGHFPCVATVSSSHNSTAERQFRFPLEYGSQRPPTAQWTATAAGAFILGRCNGQVVISEALAGRIVDKGISDQSNMGAAMAPAAASTVYEYFCQSDYAPSDFDMILTGDLGREGHAICKELLASKGLDLGDAFYDCGMMLYNKKQDTHCGGSGCGCSASVTAGYVMDSMRNGRAREVLLIGTGALMSPSSVLQGLSIAGIGHLVHFSAK